MMCLQFVASQWPRIIQISFFKMQFSPHILITFYVAVIKKNAPKQLMEETEFCLAVPKKESITSGKDENSVGLRNREVMSQL